MNAEIFASPEEVEAMFYKAFEEADLEGMMQVWDDSDDIVCIHPMGQRLTGRESIQKSFDNMFQYSPPITVETREQHQLRNGDLSVHVLHEHIHIHGEQDPQPIIIATNVYRMTENGWRMILHHASGVARLNPKNETRAPVLH